MNNLLISKNHYKKNILTNSIPHQVLTIIYQNQTITTWTQNQNSTTNTKTPVSICFHCQPQRISEDGMVEDEAGQDGWNCTATDSLVRKHGLWRAG